MSSAAGALATGEASGAGEQHRKSTKGKFRTIVPSVCPPSSLIRYYVPVEVRKEKNEARKAQVQEDRRAKRLAKQEAKRERKANQPSRPKSAAVLSSIEKNKERPVRSDKTKKLKAKLLSRSKKLEVQAAKMLEESQRAYAKYQALLEVCVLAWLCNPL